MLGRRATALRTLTRKPAQSKIPAIRSQPTTCRSVVPVSSSYSLQLAAGRSVPSVGQCFKTARTTFALNRAYVRYCSTQNQKPKTEEKGVAEQKGVQEASETKSRSWLWGAAAFVLYKFKWILGAVKFLKFAKFGSLFLSMGAYALIFGWPWAIMFITLMFISELGHVAARVYYNLPVYPANFVPLLGLISGNIVDPDPWKNAVIALAGPATCVLFLTPLSFYAINSGAQFWLSLALAAYNLQLLTMIPFGAFSGGRVCAVIHPYLLVFGFLILLCGLLVLPLSPLLWIIFLLGLYPTYQAITGKGAYAIKSNVSLTWRMIMGGMYFGVLSVIGMFLIGIMANLRSPKQVAKDLGSDVGEGTVGSTLIVYGSDDEDEVPPEMLTWDELKRRQQSEELEFSNEFKNMRI